MTLVSIAAVLWGLHAFLGWAIIRGVWTAGSVDECAAIITAVHGEGARGACWAVLHHNIDLILFGHYPPQLYWRPALAMILLVPALAPILITRLPRRLLWFSALFPFLAFCLIWGIAEPSNEELVRELAAQAGLDVETDAGMQRAWEQFSSTRFTHLGTVRSHWLGGLLATLILAVTGVLLAIPLSLFLELGQLSRLLLLRVIMTAFIGFVRGVPVLALMLVLLIVVPYISPPRVHVDVVWRLALAIALPAAVLISEAIRSAIDNIPRGQYEAAAALGLSLGVALRRVILPQVFRAAIPRVILAATEILKDTTLAFGLGGFGSAYLMGRIRSDSDWNGAIWELYFLMAVPFLVICLALLRYAAHLDRRLNASQDRNA